MAEFKNTLSKSMRLLSAVMLLITSLGLHAREVVLARTITPADADWKFLLGDPVGAESATFDRSFLAHINGPPRLEHRGITRREKLHWRWRRILSCRSWLVQKVIHSPFELEGQTSEYRVRWGFG